MRSGEVRRGVLDGGNGDRTDLMVAGCWEKSPHSDSLGNDAGVQDDRMGACSQEPSHVDWSLEHLLVLENGFLVVVRTF